MSANVLDILFIGLQPLYKLFLCYRAFFTERKYIVFRYAISLDRHAICLAVTQHFLVYVHGHKHFRSF